MYCGEDEIIDDAISSFGDVVSYLRAIDILGIKKLKRPIIKRGTSEIKSSWDLGRIVEHVALSDFNERLGGDVTSDLW